MASPIRYPEVQRTAAHASSSTTSSTSKLTAAAPTAPRLDFYYHQPTPTSSSSQQQQHQQQGAVAKSTRNRAAPPAPTPSENSTTHNHNHHHHGSFTSSPTTTNTTTSPMRHLPTSTSSTSSSSSPSLLRRLSAVPISLKRHNPVALAVAAAAQHAANRKPLACQKWTCFQVTEFLNACGLGMYSPSFEEQGVDGSILLELNPEQIERGMHMTVGLHMISLITAVQLLVEGKLKRVDEWEWTCSKTCDWLVAKGLECLVDRFQQFAVHGGVLFQLTQDEFVHELGVDNALILMSLMTSIDRARQVGPVRFGDAIPDWSLSQVKLWLEGLSLAHLHAVFRAYGINGSLLLHLDREMMVQEMGLTEIQALVLEKAIVKLQKQHATDTNRWFHRRTRSKSTTASEQPPYAMAAYSSHQNAHGNNNNTARASHPALQ